MCPNRCALTRCLAHATHAQVYSACVCCYSSCAFGDLMIGCREDGECLCIQSKFCLGVSEPFPIGMIKEEPFICKVGLPCCTLGLKMPEVLCSGASQCLCIKQAASLPFKVSGTQRI